MSKKNGPDPLTTYPLENLGMPINEKRTCFLKNLINSPNIEIGDYTYYDDPEGAERFEKQILYHYSFSKEKLIIGKFCAIAAGAEFIMSSANHKLDGFSTFPFFIFKNGWEEGFELSCLPSKGGTTIGNDVWIGYKAAIMPGVTVGSGSIIGARAVVTKDVAPYSIVGGNPARLIRKRFDDETIKELLDIAWWNWPIEKISKNIPIIISNDLEKLRAAVKNG